MANRLTMDIITKIISEKKLFWISFAIIGYFCFYVGIEEDYNKIYEGNWLNDREYAVIHRIAVMSNQKGVGGFCMRFCFDKFKNIRIWNR